MISSIRFDYSRMKNVNHPKRPIASHAGNQTMVNTLRVAYRNMLEIDTFLAANLLVLLVPVSSHRTKSKSPIFKWQLF